MKKSLIYLIGTFVVTSLVIFYSCSKNEMESFEEDLSRNELKSVSASFSTTASGSNRAMTYWGVGWIGDISKSITRMGGESQIDVVRIGCPKEWKLNSNNTLKAEAKADIDKQMVKAEKVTNVNPNAKIALVCSGGNGIHSWYVQSNGKDIRGSRWLELFRATKRYVSSQYGESIAYIEVCNEQDYGNKKGTKSNINNILAKFQADSEMGSIPMVGPSTLSCNAANSWYNAMKNNLDWGATHTIGGNGTNYVDFVKKVNNDGKQYWGSEVHNLAEMIMGTEHGTKGGCWWNTVTVDRGLFVQYCQQGNRIMYKQNKSTFSAACAFKGSAANTIHIFAATVKGDSFTFTCSNRNVYFNGVGPQKSYTVNLGKGGEKYIKVTW